MKRLALVFTLAFVFIAHIAFGTNLRGQLVRNINGVYYPLGGVRVDLMVWNGQSWIDASYAITGNDGFYFFINCAPNTIFCISVFGHYYPPQQPLTIQNLAPQYYQDIPVIST